jgi:general secretion pathway protein E/type IV pilus assembly protein PilB
MAQALQLPLDAISASRGAGCVECSQKGYRGRVAIYEFFLINDAIADLIGPDVKTGQLREAARAYGWRSLREQGWFKVQNGLISISEQERMTRHVGIAQLAAVH